MEGWIKIHRKLLDNPIVCKDADYLAIWVYLLLKANHEPLPVIFRGEKIILKPGQLITGRIKIASELSITENKVRHVLNCFKNDQQINQQTSNRNSLITILNWELYQKNNQQNHQQTTSKPPTNHQQTTTNKNIKNDKNERNIKDILSPGTSTGRTEKENPSSGTSTDRYKAVIEYLNTKTGKSYRYQSKDTQKHIHARMKDGYVLEDFYRVIDNKVADWKDSPEMNKFLRPSTLFGTKFEDYLNQEQIKNRPVKQNRFNNFEQRNYDFGDLESKFLTRNQLTGGGMEDET